ncbi:MAG: putative membrane protein YdbT with pleckstrin-like domain [Myxococcota bacterium]|jgi:uncharacterized membrane protein YdbT with pleckstrin-like domain
MAATTTTRPTLRLQDGETVLLQGTPSAEMVPAATVGSMLVAVVCVFTLPLVPFVPLIVRQSLGWHQWWLTDRRLVVRDGFIGWSIRSVPLDRIVDVTTKASWWDRLWGVEHVTVRDMTGEVGSGGVSTGLRLIAPSDAARVAERILAEAPRSAVSGAAGEMGDVVRLLQTLVDRAA